MDLEARLKEMQLALPQPPKALGAYIPARREGQLVYTSGTLPIDGAGRVQTGRLGDDLDIAAGQAAAKLAALNALANTLGVLDSLNQIDHIVRLVGFVQATADFTEHAQVLNGASEFFLSLMGDRGRHARSAVGVASLPKGAAVELELWVATS